MAKYKVGNLDPWAKKTIKRQTLVVRQAAQNMMFDASETVVGITRGGTFVRGKIPVDIGTLAASQTASLNGATIAGGEDAYIAVVGAMEAGDTAVFGWGGAASDYVLAVHYGTATMSGRFWVTDAVAGWQAYVNAAVREAKARVA